MTVLKDWDEWLHGGQVVGVSAVWTELRSAHATLGGKGRRAYTPEHLAGVDTVVARGYRTKRFRLAVLRAVAHALNTQAAGTSAPLPRCEPSGNKCNCPTECTYVDDGEHLCTVAMLSEEYKQRCLPDGYKIWPQRQLVEVVEVNVGHVAPPDKWAPLWWFLDDHSWNLRVRCIDRDGVESFPISQGHFFEVGLQAMRG